MTWNNPPIKTMKSVIVPALRGEITPSVTVPGSKSVTNRAFLLAAAAQGKSTLHHFLRADDSHWCCDVLNRLGVQMEWIENGVKIHGTNGDWSTKNATLYLGDAGTLARFLPGLLAASPEGRWTISASDQLARRPILPVLDSLSLLGAKIDVVPQQPYPYIIEGGGFIGGSTKITGETSSQFVSGLLIAAPLAAQQVSIQIDGALIQKDYVAMTLRMMEDFGVSAEATPDYTHFTIPSQRYRACDYAIEADASTASYFFALAAATHRTITVSNCHRNCLQPDIGFLLILERLGCTVEETTRGITIHPPKKLRGHQSFNMESISDTVPTLAAIAPFADGPITITNVAHIRHHESDRLHALHTVLTACGVPCDEEEDGLIIQPTEPHFAEVPSFGDHRIAMAMSIMGLAGAGVQIDDPGCVAKTCPVFFELLEKMGLNIEYIK